MDTTEAILAERGQTHGDFSDHARVTQNLKTAMYDSPNWDKLPAIMREALEMNVHKIGRILSGKPDHQDHWDDIAGYAKLVSQRIAPVCMAALAQAVGAPKECAMPDPHTRLPFSLPQAHVLDEMESDGNKD